MGIDPSLQNFRNRQGFNTFQILFGIKFLSQPKKNLSNKEDEIQSVEFRYRLQIEKEQKKILSKWRCQE